MKHAFNFHQSTHLPMRYFVAIALCLGSLKLAAQSFSIESSYYYFDYEEFGTTNQSLNNETGRIPSLGLNWDYAFSVPIKATFELAYAANSVDYNGRTQRGRPHQTETEQTFKDVSLQISHENLLSEFGVHAEIELKRKSWRRAIQARNNVSYLNEDYHWLEWRFGVGTLYTIGPGVLSFDASKLLIRNGSIKVDSPSFADFHPSLTLGDGNGSVWNIAYQIQLSKKQTWKLSAFYAEWNFSRGNSETFPTGRGLVTITEPRSETAINGVSLKYTYAFN